MISTRHWIASLGTAGLLHAVALAALLDLQPAEGAKASGENGIVIDLGMLGALGNETADLRASEAAPPPPPEPVIEEVVETPPPPPPVQKAEVAVKKPKAEKPQKAQEKPQEKPLDHSSSEPPATQRSESQGADQQTAFRQSTGSADGMQGGGNPDARPSYYSQLAAHLARHKQYPSSARRKGEEGVVTLSFTLARDGRVLDYRIATSSGSPRLDEAVVEMLNKAAPLPPFPEEITQQQLSIRLPIAFALKERR